MEDIARRLGLTKATVSRALNNRRHVAPETRDRVAAVAKELGYRLDPALQALSLRRWSNADSLRFHVALVHLSQSSVRKEGGTAQRDKLYAELQQRATSFGMLISEFVLTDYPSEAALHRVLFTRGVDGILLDIDQPVIPWRFHWEHFAFLSLGLGCDEVRQISSDWIGMVRTAYRETGALGYRRPGVVQLVHGNPGIDARLEMAGLYERSTRNGTDARPLPSPLRVPPEVSRSANWEAGRRAFAAWLRREQPDVVIDASTFAYSFLLDLGWKPGDSPGLCGLYRKFERKFAPLACVDPDFAEQGRLAAEQMLFLIQNQLRGLPERPSRTIVPCVWQPGKSLPKATEARSWSPNDSSGRRALQPVAAE